MGQQFEERDCLELDGKLVKKAGKAVRAQAPRRVLLACYKPRGVVCSCSDKDRAKNIVELVSYPERVYPIGRLDKDSEGLILLTNQGELVNRINRGGRNEKEYVVTVDKPLTREALDRLADGVELPESKDAPLRGLAGSPPPAGEKAEAVSYCIKPGTEPADPENVRSAWL